MLRREALAAAGGTFAVGLAGCLGGEGPTATNEFDYPTLEVEGVDVPLAPVDDTFRWYEREEAAFIDARSRRAYEAARVVGAALSPAPTGLPSDDPLRALDPQTRIVTYCGCPHHLSTLRASTAIENGYRNVYAIDEGFFEWANRGYPVEGRNVEGPDLSIRLRGRATSADAGGYVWLYHDPSGQREVAPVGEDGRFTIPVNFYGVDPGSTVRVVGPGGEERTATIRALAEQGITL